jgi:RNA polymerase sigma factor (sigma-70 family)
MPVGDTSPLLHHIRHLLGGAPEAALSDGQLLERFLADRDATAVEALVRRYGPLVFGACRRVLGDAHAAEDVFQATFLVLVRKAAVLDRGQPLAGWLYTVAHRLALTARANEFRRQRGEEQAARRRDAADDTRPSPSELEAALEEELPERYRTPLVLCYLEGKTNGEAAQVLGCPVGSMSARLNQARQRLRESLRRRGHAVPAAGLAALLGAAKSEAFVPLPLLCNTARAAVWFAGEQENGAGLVSSAAVALARGACRATLLNKLKLAAAVLLMCALLGSGATMLLRAAAPPSRDDPAAGQPAAGAPGERLPQGAVARMGTTQLRHGDAVTFAAWMPDGSRLVTAGKDWTVRLWDLATGTEVRRFAWPQLQQRGKAEPTEEGTAEKSQRQLVEEIGLSRRFALSADGELVAASVGGVVCVWETARGTLRRTWETGEKRLIQLAFAPDGKSLFTLAPGGHAASVWEVATGRRLRLSPGKLAANFYPAGGVNKIEDEFALVSPGWKYLAYQRRDAPGNRWIHLMDLATGKVLSRIDAGGFGGTQTFCFSPDDKRLFWEHIKGRGIVVSDVTTGQGLRRLGDHGPRYQDSPFDPAVAIACSPDGKKIAVCRWAHTIELWDLASGKRTDPVGKPTRAQTREYALDSLGARVPAALAFSRDGKTLVTSLGGAVIRRFRTDTGREIPGPGSGHRASVSVLGLSAGGKSLCTWGPGDPARRWDWRTGKQTGQPGVPAGATHAVFAGEGGFAFAVGDRLTVCGLTGKQTWKIPAALPRLPLAALALSPDGKHVALQRVATGEVHLWDAAGKQRHTLGRADGPTFSALGVTEATGVVSQDLAFSPDGRFLAGGGPKQQLCLWDVSTRDLLWRLPLEAGTAIERFTFSPDGNVLATIHADGTVSLLETLTGSERARLGETDLTTRKVHLVFMNGGKVAPVETRRANRACLAFSRDGRYLAVAREKPAIHLWDVLAGREVGRLEGHHGGVVSLLFGADGKHLFSGGSDTTVLTWDLTRLTQRQPARATALRARDLEVLWNDLASSDAARAFAAIGKLCASPDQAISLLDRRVRPAASPEGERLASLVADLQSSRFEVRRQAQSELEGLDTLAEPALRQALADDPPLELRQRLERLLSRSSKRAPAGQLRNLRAVEVLELVGSPAARQVLQKLAAGVPGSRLTRQARSASRRLDERVVRP